MPVSNLTNTNISETYVSILHSNGDPLPSSGQQRMYDGVGNMSSISIGRNCNGVTVCGLLSCTSLQTQQKIDATNIDLSGIVNLIYPVGSVYFSVNSSPPTFGGTWTQISQGRYIAGIGTGSDGVESVTLTPGAGGGTYKHQLTEGEMPAHSHNLSLNLHRDLLTTGVGIQAGSGRFYQQTVNYTTSSKGSTQYHNNMPPYFGLYVWQRTA